MASDLQEGLGSRANAWHTRMSWVLTHGLPPQLTHEELLFPFLCRLQLSPGSVDIGHQLALRGHIRGPVAKAELSLQSVKVSLQSPLLFGLGGLGDGVVLAELLHTSLGVWQGVLLGLVVQPRHGLLDPLNQLEGRGGEGRGGEGR